MGKASNGSLESNEKSTSQVVNPFIDEGQLDRCMDTLDLPLDAGQRNH